MACARNDVSHDALQEMSVIHLHTDANLIGPGSPGQVRSPKAAAGPVLLQCMVVAAASSTLLHQVV